jgi:hypothetical protein
MVRRHCRCEYRVGSATRCGERSVHCFLHCGHTCAGCGDESFAPGALAVIDGCGAFTEQLLTAVRRSRAPISGRGDDKYE